MKIKSEEYLISQGEFVKTAEFQQVEIELREAVHSVNWGHDSKFIINPVKKANGVVPIKDNFVSKLKDYGWRDEVRMSLAKGMNPGPIDVTKKCSAGIVAVEWETGNISSSHRALNKIAVGIIQKQIIGGILILPIKGFSQFLTDRIGNYEELAPYFPMYQNLKIQEGFIGIIAIEHDEVSYDADFIPKGKDGNAKK